VKKDSTQHRAVFLLQHGLLV